MLLFQNLEMSHVTGSTVYKYLLLAIMMLGFELFYRVGPQIPDFSSKGGRSVGNFGRG